MSQKKNKTNKLIITIILIILISIITYINENIEYRQNDKQSSATGIAVNIENIPEYNENIYIEINNNKPYFNEEDYTTKPFEKYSELDYLGRCGVAYANICKEIMPPEGDRRGDISSIRPTGWKQAKFEGKYLYNRCHLIAHSLSDEDDNKQNLITGTRYFNVQGMLPFERKVYEYIEKNKKSHVLYRVTPIFKENNLLASGVEMEAYSVEDNGKGVCFNVYVYNVQPGASIDYSTGKLLKNTN